MFSTCWTWSTSISNFVCQMLHIDEANFSSNAVINFHGGHLWAEENPHGIAVTHFQDEFSDFFKIWINQINRTFPGN